ncbi:MAG: type II toxin-antitoxin system Phd/YefM family antitoxin [Alphaproteobacteria bacterium]|nr:type II toxin-antitoxin system Phd/YefM family antitoxin [Alphaproteobacteria bacterium]
MKTVNVHHAKTHLSRLLEQVAAGEDVVIAKSGKPVARLIPFKPSEEPRRPGSMKIWIADDFDAPLPADMLREFGIDP